MESDSPIFVVNMAGGFLIAYGRGVSRGKEPTISFA